MTTYSKYEKISNIKKDENIKNISISVTYDPDSHAHDFAFNNMQVKVYCNGNYKIDFDLEEEYILGGRKK